MTENTSQADTRVELSDEEWREKLSPERYAVLRQAAHRAGLVRRAAPRRRGGHLHLPRVAARPSSRPTTSSSRGPVGRASTGRWPRAPSRSTKTGASSCGAPRSPAPAAVAISATSSPTGRRRPVSATASTRSRSSTSGSPGPTEPRPTGVPRTARRGHRAPGLHGHAPTGTAAGRRRPRPGRPRTLRTWSATPPRRTRAGGVLAGVSPTLRLRSGPARPPSRSRRSRRRPRDAAVRSGGPPRSRSGGSRRPRRQRSPP